MSDELQNYQLQLQQVEAALLSDPDNQELQKLKIDLKEVIELTLDLKNKAEEAANQPEYTDPVGVTEEDEITKSLLAVEEFVARNRTKKMWRVGDICMAKWNENGQYYEARIDVINPDGQVNVTFEAYKNRGVTTLSELREFTGQKRVLSESEKMKKAKLHNKEYLKRKKLKKQQRFKELEEERETEKKKWLAFANKAVKNKKTGLKTKSIFASPDSVNGRVGIGTCGISGKPMTEFTTAEKWRKGT
ncbi:survival of motor neuron-related-splicing factor 30 [Diorhabda carinulata]|uniref:survival of motor neuron-related-splicing factor 30 n=1 Tax=Diorhabda sublineata TaxID=1163346 RepID=UPI0024E167D2|nr:survival of motor neuron-related-splicing factor 30 [Diorhabda sublineata]XP_057653199.1 survival of motor neuron-related-splicing factor 30 [Diorhabda carinulata]